jgi:4'-phosphopantetheinyl transferase
MLPAWPPPPAALFPPEGEALVLALSLALPGEQVRALRELLSQDERAKSDRFAFPELGARSTAARGQLRQILGGALEKPPAALRFEYGASGKPALAEGALRFNLSHSGDLALLALARCDLGVDVELHAPRSLADVAQRFFALGERARFFASPPELRTACFFETWTAKEAFVKATGDGITVPLEDFEARWDAPGEGHIEVLRGPTSGRRFWLRALEVGEGASGALVAEGAPLVVRCANWLSMG